MRTGQLIETTSPGRFARLTRRLLAALVLATIMTIAAAGATLSAERRPSGQQRPAPVHTGTAATGRSASQGGSSPVVPLIFAGILFLAVASPALPRYHFRYSPYRGERW